MQLALEHRAGRALRSTARHVRWGFLAVEFRAQATGGTHLRCVAFAACAGALQQLFDLTAVGTGAQSTQSPQVPAASHCLADTLCSTLAIDGQTAVLHANGTNGAGPLLLQRRAVLRPIHARRAHDLKRDVNAVISRGLSPRLQTIRGVLGTST